MYSTAATEPSLHTRPREAARQAHQTYSVQLMSKLAAILGILFLVWAAVNQANSLSQFPFWTSLIGTLVSFACWRLCGHSRQKLSTRLWLSRIYLVLLCLVLASLEAQQLKGGEQPGISRVCLVVVMAPALLPSARLWHSLSLCLVLAGSLPLVHGLLLYTQHETLSQESLLSLLRGDLLALGVALFPMISLARMKEDSMRAHEMGSYLYLS